MKVLIADDEKLTREGLRDRIDWESLGFTDVRCADDGLRGLEIGRQFRPDVILTDVRMPRLNGIQMSEQIQQFCPESSIIIMSGYSDKEYLKAAIRLHAVSYVEKPIDLEEITAALREAAVRVANENRNRIHSKAMVAYELTLYPEQRGEIYMDPSWFRRPPEQITSAFTIVIQNYDRGRMTTEESAKMISDALTPLFDNMSLEKIYTMRSPVFIFQIFSRLRLSDGQTEFLGNRIAEELTGLLGSFHVVIGKQVSNYADLHESYESAVILLQATFFQPVNTCLTNRHVQEKLAFRPLTETDHETRLKLLLANRDREKLSAFADELLAFLTHERDYILPNQIRDLYYRLNLAILSAARSMQLEQVLSLDSGVIWNAVNSCNSIYELDRLFAGNIRSFCEAMDTPSGESETIYNIRNYIARSYMNPSLSIKEISSYAHLSTSYLCTVFKNETGMTLNQYITEYRMARARDLLDDPRSKIVEIAGQVGYNDSNYFSKTFRKAFGMSPSEYREQNGAGGDL